MKTLIDTHCHLDLPAFDDDRAKAVARAKQQGIWPIINPSVDRSSWVRIHQLADELQILPGYGLHPCFLATHQPQDLEALDHWLSVHPAVAVGEIGLDYNLKVLDRDQQKFYFERQLEIAANHRLPVIIHARKSIQEVLLTLRRYKAIPGGILHSFSGSYEQALEAHKLGYLVGLGGPATWRGSYRLHKLLGRVPQDSIVLETDSPDQADELHRGQRNEPAYLRSIVTQLAELLRVDPDELGALSNRNCRRVFKLEEEAISVSR